MLRNGSTELGFNQNNWEVLWDLLCFWKLRTIGSNVPILGLVPYYVIIP